jgi:hypothetical protein
MVTTRRNNDEMYPNPRKKEIKKKADRLIQKHAFNELLRRKSINGGNLKFGDIQKVVDEFQDLGYNAVTRLNLNYCLANLIKKGQVTLVSEQERPTRNVTVTGVTDLSPLTGDEAEASQLNGDEDDDGISTDKNDAETDPVVMDDHNNLTSINSVIDTGTGSSKRKEALEKKKKVQLEHQLVQEALLTISSKYKEIQDAAKAKVSMLEMVLLIN